MKAIGLFIIGFGMLFWLLAAPYGSYSGVDTLQCTKCDAMKNIEKQGSLNLLPGNPETMASITGGLRDCPHEWEAVISVTRQLEYTISTIDVIFRSILFIVALSILFMGFKEAQTKIGVTE